MAAKRNNEMMCEVDFCLYEVNTRGILETAAIRTGALNKQRAPTNTAFLTARLFLLL